MFIQHNYLQRWKRNGLARRGGARLNWQSAFIDSEYDDVCRRRTMTSSMTTNAVTMTTSWQRHQLTIANHLPIVPPLPHQPRHQHHRALCLLLRRMTYLTSHDTRTVKALLTSTRWMQLLTLQRMLQRTLRWAARRRRLTAVEVSAIETRFKWRTVLVQSAQHQTDRRRPLVSSTAIPAGRVLQSDPTLLLPPLLLMWRRSRSLRRCVSVRSLAPTQRTSAAHTAETDHQHIGAWTRSQHQRQLVLPVSWGRHQVAFSTALHVDPTQTEFTARSFNTLEMWCYCRTQGHDALVVASAPLLFHIIRDWTSGAPKVLLLYGFSRKAVQERRRRLCVPPSVGHWVATRQVCSATWWWQLEVSFDASQSPTMSTSWRVTSILILIRISSSSITCSRSPGCDITATSAVNGLQAPSTWISTNSQSQVATRHDQRATSWIPQRTVTTVHVLIISQFYQANSAFPPSGSVNE